MTGISVRKVDPAEPGSASLLKEIETLYDQIQKKAFELFEQRGCGFGNEMNDWLNAESQFVLAPPSELVEGKKAFEIHVAAPGFTADQFKVDVLPDCIIVSAKVDSKKQEKHSKIHFSEMSHKDMLRRFYLPVKIDPDQVHASLEDGILKIVARKAAEIVRKPVAVRSGKEVQARPAVA